MDCVHDWSSTYYRLHEVGQKHKSCTTNSLYCKLEECRPFMNKIEQEWTGVEEKDRAIISTLGRVNLKFLILVRLL